MVAAAEAGVRMFCTFMQLLVVSLKCMRKAHEIIFFCTCQQRLHLKYEKNPVLLLLFLCSYSVSCVVDNVARTKCKCKQIINYQNLMNQWFLDHRFKRKISGRTELK